jgi:copper chaperone CopZ
MKERRMRRHALPLLAGLSLACAVVAVENATTTLSIKGITSDQRLSVVETLLKQATGVTQYAVRKDLGEAELTYDPNATDPATVAEALQKAGFQVRLLPWEFADASFKGCSNGWCGSRRPNAKVGPQPGAALGQDVYCPVSGVVLRVKDSTLRADLNGKPLHVCCEGCLRYFQANREKVLALRGLASRG